MSLTPWDIRFAAINVLLVMDAQEHETTERIGYDVRRNKGRKDILQHPAFTILLV
jgi:hypothetical protein